MLVLYQIFYACAGHCERGIVHKIAWHATRSCMPHPLAQCIQTLIGDTLELFMTQCGYNGAEIRCAGENRLFDASHQHWRAGGNYPVNMTIGRFLPFIADLDSTHDTGDNQRLGLDLELLVKFWFLWTMKFKGK